MSDLRPEIARFIEAQQRLADAEAHREAAETACREAGDALDAAWEALTDDEQRAVNALYALAEEVAA